MYNLGQATSGKTIAELNAELIAVRAQLSTARADFSQAIKDKQSSVWWSLLNATQLINAIQANKRANNLKARIAELEAQEAAIIADIEALKTAGVVSDVKNLVTGGGGQNLLLYGALAVAAFMFFGRKKQ